MRPTADPAYPHSVRAQRLAGLTLAHLENLFETDHRLPLGTKRQKVCALILLKRRVIEHRVRDASARQSPPHDRIRCTSETSRPPCLAFPSENAAEMIACRRHAFANCISTSCSFNTAIVCFSNDEPSIQAATCRSKAWRRSPHHVFRRFGYYGVTLRSPQDVARGPHPILPLR